MKLISAVIASALAGDWPGQSDVDPCGTQVNFAESSINATCTLDFNGYNPWRVFLGGEWITGQYSFTNYDGMGGDSIDVVVFWEEGYQADGITLDNSTCGATTDVTVSCAPQGSAVAGVYFQENANDFRMAKGSNYNVQIVGASAGDTLTIQLNDAYGNPYGAQNLSTNSGTITADGVNVVQDAWGNLYTDTGLINLNVGDETADVVNLFTTQQPGQNWEPSFWHSTVTN
jgi:hypothetical protein